MKKNILLVLIFIGMFFIRKTEVFALNCKIGDEDCTPKKIAETYPGAYPICIYEVNFDKKKYYNYIMVQQELDGDISFLSATTNGTTISRKLSNDFSASGVDYIIQEAYDKLINNGICPKYSYIDNDGNNEVCFDNGESSNGNYCRKEGNKFGNNEKEKKQSSILINDYNLANLLLYKDIPYKKACSLVETQSEYKICKYNSKSGTGNDIILYYNSKTNFISMYDADRGKRFVVSEKLPFVRDYISGNYARNYGFYNNINKGISSCPKNLFLYEEKGSTYGDLKLYSSAQNMEYKKIETFENVPCYTEKPTPKPEPDPKGCEGLINGKLREYLNVAMSIPRIGVPILLIGLLIYDFATAMFASSDDKMTKAKSKAIKRIVISVVIFFVPTFMNLIFDLVNDVWQKNFEICEVDK